MKIVNGSVLRYSTSTWQVEALAREKREREQRIAAAKVMANAAWRARVDDEGLCRVCGYIADALTVECGEPCV